MIVESHRLNKIFANLKDLPIAVVGDVMLDRYIWGNAERISQEAPVPIVSVEHETTRLGGAANVAWNVRSLGAKPLLFGVIGEDLFAQKFLKLLNNFEIDENFLAVDNARPTTSKTRIIARGQQVLRIDRENYIDISDKVEKKLLDKIIDSLDDVSAIIISDYGKGVISRSFLKKLIPIAHKKNKFIAVDPKERHFKIYKNVSIITPNTKEASDAVGIKIHDYDTLLKAGKKLKKLTMAKNILITRGSDGMSLFYDDSSIKNFPTVARQVYDVTGAGDTVAGVFASIVASGGTLDEAAIISSHAAGIVVGEIGTATANVQEIEKSIQFERTKQGSRK